MSDPSEMLDQYDFSEAERGRFHVPLDHGYTVEIHMDDGSTRIVEGKLMSVVTADEIYEKYVRPLSPTERLRLLERTARELAEEPSLSVDAPEYSVMELRGLGKEAWEGADPKRYVDTLREEWGNEP